MVIPNFFIVGAPKCGATALDTYLKDQPSVFLSQTKESHCFFTGFPRLAEFAMHPSFPLDAIKATTKTMLGRSHFSMPRKLYMGLTRCPSRRLKQLLNRELTRWVA